MNAVTGRRAAPGRGEKPPGTRTDPPAAPARGGAVAPQPRVVPGPDETPVEVEPTTGAPVDAVPRRVPVRQPARGPRTDRGTDAGTAEGDAAFWAPIEEVHWDGTPLREEPKRGERPPTGPARPRPSRAAHPPDPVRGLAVLVTLSLVAAFFAWVSAGPFWLAVGHASTGTVVITDCTGDGLTQRCRGVFFADRGRFLAHGVRVSGVSGERRATGTALPARMTGAGDDTAYVGTGFGRHLSWLLGLLVVAGCGAGIARGTGANRLADARQRRWATAGAYGGPVLITLGMLIAAW
ncbi:hypothetical protein FHX75_12417 [Micromonospora palomenae]|uniref:Uncharacterized protein n=1 Tax=Micromonospora palomenae TaxID=1461247 RepID=A0A561WDF8_9ACTN|nr:hypothetical protein [Micromonospora palomenae]TWG21900.1 hypothetical protein FHX75_12417 [Micromonospora palomenae]